MTSGDFVCSRTPRAKVSVLCPAVPEFEPGGAPPPPEDRLWRHPSELRAANASAGASSPVTDTAGLDSLSAEHPGPPSTEVGRVGRMGRGLTVRGWALLPVVVVSALAGAALVTVLDRPKAATEVATPIRERTAIQQVAYPSTDTLEPTKPEAAGNTSKSVARVVVKSGNKSRLGTGVVLRSSHTLVTASDLVVGADRVTVVFEVDDRRPAEVVGVDPTTGLAVLRFEGAVRGPPVIGSTETLDDQPSVNLLIGTGMTPLMAPTSLEGQATLRVGGVERPNLFQAQPPRAQGVIGAAVLDSLGTLVGLVTHVRNGVAYVTPIEAARRVEGDLSRFGFVREADLGVAMVDNAEGGVEVVEVATDGPSVDALASGEVILAFNGQAVTAVSDIAISLIDMVPGDKVSMQVVGPDGPRTTYVTLGPSPS